MDADEAVEEFESMWRLERSRENKRGQRWLEGHDVERIQGLSTFTRRVLNIIYQATQQSTQLRRS